MAEYPNALGVNAQIRYVGKSGTHAAGETWQTGLRIAWREVDTPWDFSAGRVDLVGKTVADALVTRTNAVFSIEQGWAGTDLGNTPTDGEQDAIAQAFYEWAVDIRGSLSNQYALGDIRLYPFLEDGTSATAPSIYTPSGTGGAPQATSSMPLDTAFAMSLGTAVRGPSGRGRMFIGGLGSNVLAADGTPVGTAADKFRSDTAILLTSLRFGGPVSLAYTPIIFTRGTTTGSVIRNVRTNNVFETQRRRDRQVTPVWAETVLT